MLEVVEPGLLSTIQDSGRHGYGHLGVPRSGACDPWGYVQANLLAQTGPPRAALEVTIGGPTLVVRENCMVALGGADLGAYVPEELRRLPPGRAHRVRAATHITFDATRVRGRSRGARAYLALASGIDVPEMLGSASTYVPAAIGGIEGRPIQSGDVLRPRRPGDLRAVGRVWPDRDVPPPYAHGSSVVLRIVEGPHRELFDADPVEWLTTTEWTVAGDADRTGVRLTAGRNGPSGQVGARARAAPSAPEIASTPMVWGAVQLPPDADPIVLLADHGTVGGYPVAAVVIRADWPALGQLLPGQPVSFNAVSIADAQFEYRLQLNGLARAGLRMDADDPWVSAVDLAAG